MPNSFKICRDNRARGLSCRVSYVTHKYETAIDKIWLALLSFQEAKEQLTTEFGLGESLMLNLYGWRGDRLVLVCGFAHNPSRTHAETLDLSYEVARQMRLGWGVDTFTLLNEGFCVLPGESDEFIDLPRQFASGVEGIAECIALIHVEPDYCKAVATPFRYGLKRSIAFGDPIFYEPNDDGWHTEFAKIAQLAEPMNSSARTTIIATLTQKGVEVTEI
jgi:hypothetical protein